MFELTIPTGFTQVTDLSVLSLSGSRSANYFFADDTIKISDKVYSQLRPSATQTGEDGKPKMQPVYYALVNITHKGSDKGYDKLLPLAAFRRLPKDSETFLSTAGDLMRQLAGMSSDRERFELLKGLRLFGKQLCYSRVQVPQEQVCCARIRGLTAHCK